MASPIELVSCPAEKGLFDTLPAEAQMIAMPGREWSGVNSARRRSAVPSPIQSLLKPHTLLLLILGFAVLAWGFGDRLTRYKNSPDPLKRTLVARLWVDQQTTLRDVSAKLQTPPHSIFDLFLSVEMPRPVSHRYIETVLSAPRVQCAVAYFHPLLPLRSPPSNPFLA